MRKYPRRRMPLEDLLSGTLIEKKNDSGKKLCNAKTF